MTAKQRAFIEAYVGNAAEAAIIAGYSKKTARSIGQELLTKPDILQAIQEREKKRLDELILDREARMRLLTDIAQNGKRDSERIKAVDVLNKMSGEYLERVEVKQEATVFTWQE